MFRSRLLKLLSPLILLARLDAAPAPEPYGATPTEVQMAWHEMEYYGLLCFGLNTFIGMEWGYGDAGPKLFNPDHLDTDQWARAARDGGMKGLILVAKHHDGFCLWPSETTDYDIAASPWKDGQGDLVADFVASCKKFGLKPGIYISPWDRNHAEYGREAYVKAFHEQWRELLTLYGEDLFELWLDGANGGDGYYGGARETRSIGRDYYRYPELYAMMKELAPHAVVFQGVGHPDPVRWNGNETGISHVDNWSTVDRDQVKGRVYQRGLKGGPHWMPSEADTPLYKPKRWYWSQGLKPRGRHDMFDLWFTSVGRNSALNLGLAPTTSGLLQDADRQALVRLREDLDQAFADNLAKKATVTAEPTRGKDFGSDLLTDGDPHSYWASADGAGSATLTFTFEQPVTANCVWLQEGIRLGQRVDSFTVEAQAEDGSWASVGEGLTIGWKRLLRFPEVTAKALRVSLESQAPALTLAEIGFYQVPVFKDEPRIARRGGNVVLSCEDATALRYALGEDPSEDDFRGYSQPFALPDGGVVSAYALHDEERSPTVSATFGVDPSGWKVTDSSELNAGNKRAHVHLAIDGSPDSFWSTAVMGKETALPQWVSVDFGTDLRVKALTYLPRQLGRAVDAAHRYRMELSSDGEDWQVVAEGEFSNILNNPVEQIIPLESPVIARHLRFTALSVVGEGVNTLGVAELGVRGAAK